MSAPLQQAVAAWDNEADALLQQHHRELLSELDRHMLFGGRELMQALHLEVGELDVQKLEATIRALHREFGNPLQSPSRCLLNRITSAAHLMQMDAWAPVDV